MCTLVYNVVYPECCIKLPRCSKYHISSQIPIWSERWDQYAEQEQGQDQQLWLRSDEDCFLAVDKDLLIKVRRLFKDSICNTACFQIQDMPPPAVFLACFQKAALKKLESFWKFETGLLDLLSSSQDQTGRNGGCEQLVGAGLPRSQESQRCCRTRFGQTTGSATVWRRPKMSSSMTLARRGRDSRSTGFKHPHWENETGETWWHMTHAHVISSYLQCKQKITSLLHGDLKFDLRWKKYTLHCIPENNPLARLPSLSAVMMAMSAYHPVTWCGNTAKLFRS